MGKKKERDRQRFLERKHLQQIRRESHAWESGRIQAQEDAAARQRAREFIRDHPLNLLGPDVFGIPKKRKKNS